MEQHENSFLSGWDRPCTAFLEQETSCLYSTNSNNNIIIKKEQPTLEKSHRRKKKKKIYEIKHKKTKVAHSNRCAVKLAPLQRVTEPILNTDSCVISYNIDVAKKSAKPNPLHYKRPKRLAPVTQSSYSFLGKSYRRERGNNVSTSTTFQTKCKSSSHLKRKVVSELYNPI